MEVTWKKIGGGSLRFKGRIIKPGQIFKADPNEIPESFRDVIIPTDPIVVSEQKEKEFLKKVQKVEYEKIPTERGNRFNIVNKTTGKNVNDKPLTEKQADDFLADLNEVQE